MLLKAWLTSISDRWRSHLDEHSMVNERLNAISLFLARTGRNNQTSRIKLCASPVIATPRGVQHERANDNGLRKQLDFLAKGSREVRRVAQREHVLLAKRIAKFHGTNTAGWNESASRLFEPGAG
jgi:hypothetical protein